MTVVSAYVDRGTMANIVNIVDSRVNSCWRRMGPAFRVLVEGGLCMNAFRVSHGSRSCKGCGRMQPLSGRICTAHLNVAFKEGTAASALFIITLAAVICVGFYFVWRVLKRSKRLQSFTSNRSPTEECTESDLGNSVTDDDAGLIWKDDEQLVPEDHQRHSGRLHLTSPVSDDTGTACTSLFYIRSPAVPPRPRRPIKGSRSVSSCLSHFQKGASTRSGPAKNWNATSIPSVLDVDSSDFDDSAAYLKNGMKISSSCSEYYFLSVQEGNGDEDEEEHET